MTDEEKKQLVDAVITQLKSEGTDVSNANIVSNANGIDYVVAYGKNGQIVRAVPTAISSEKVGATGYMNAYTEAGVYNINTIGGEDLPIDNKGAISARLTVLVTESGGNKVITHVLNLNNNEGGEGNVYIRSCQNGEWKAWGKLQTNIEVGQVNTLDHLTDNGIYSGVLTDGTPTSVGTFYDTFVLIVINNYSVSIPTGNPQSISQLKYSLGLNGSISVASRKRDQYGYWDNWVSLDEKSLVEEEKTRAEHAEQDIKDKAVEADSLKFLTRANVVALDYKTIEGVGDEITIPAATSEKAGVMSATDKVKLNNSYKDINVSPNKIDVELDIEDNAENTHHVTLPAATAESAGMMSSEDKKALDSIPNEIEKIKNGDTIVGQAREIHSRNGKTVADSFLARTTAGSGTIGDGVATLKSVGGNIVKNLLGQINSIAVNVKYDISLANANIVITAKDNYIGDSAGSTYIGIKTGNYLSGHKYYIAANCYSDVERNVSVAMGYNGYGGKMFYFPTIGAGEWTYISKLVELNIENPVSYISIFPFGHVTEYIQAGVLVFAGGINIIDLTEMFGAGKEPDQATCDRLFGTMDALSQGLSIANPTEFKSIGFNQFNPENVLEGKAIVDNAIVSGDKKIAVIPCLPCKVGTGENNGYCIHGDFGDDIKVYLTPLNLKNVDGELYMHELTKDATTDTYVPLIKGYMLVEVPTTTNLCAHFLWSEDKCERDTYEPYFESKVELPVIPQMSEWGLAGIQSSGTLACDEIDFERGVYVKRIGAVDLGSLTYRYTADLSRFDAALIDVNFPIIPTTKVANICTKSYITLSGVTFDSLTNTSKIIRTDNSTSRIYIRDLAYTNGASLKTELQGVMLYYELATPEEYPLPKVANNYTSSDYGVEQFDSVVPCNANNLYYMRSLAGETRNFLDRLMAGLGTSDATVVADRILAVVNPAVEPANIEPETPIEE